MGWWISFSLWFACSWVEVVWGTSYQHCILEQSKGIYVYYWMETKIYIFKIFSLYLCWDMELPLSVWLVIFLFDINKNIMFWNHFLDNGFKCRFELILFNTLSRKSYESINQFLPIFSCNSSSLGIVDHWHIIISEFDSIFHSFLKYLYKLYWI